MIVKSLASPALFIVACLALFFSACSSTPHQNKPIQLSANAPTVLNAHAEPGTIVLNGELQPVNPVQVLADVKDFKSRVVEAKLKFTDVPLEVPMENVGGTTWRAQLSPQELQMLAVSGKTVRYNAVVIARDSLGQTSSPSEPVVLAVKAPSYAHQFG